MLFLAVTPEPLRDNFSDDSHTITEITVGSLILTLVTDTFMSHLSSDSEGFSLIESPTVNSQDPSSTVFTNITFSRRERRVSIFKPTHSGRPLYYHHNNTDGFFCSTHISLLRRARVAIQENTRVLPEFFVYRHVTPPATLYKGINQLCIGGRLDVLIADGRCVVEPEHKYNPFDGEDSVSRASVSPESGVSSAYTSLAHAMSRLDSCRDRLALLLSGGLDSSILFALSKDLLGTHNSYSTCYPFADPARNTEREYAVSAAASLGSAHSCYVTDTPRYLHGLLEAICAAEEPLHHLQSVMMYLLFKHGLPNQHDIVVSGGGADGLFGLTLQRDVYLWRTRRLYRLLSKEPLLSLSLAVSRISGRGGGFVDRLRTLPEIVNSTLDDPHHVAYLHGKWGSYQWVCDYFRTTREDVIENRRLYLDAFRDRSIYDQVSLLDLHSDIAITQSIWSKLAEDGRKMLYHPFTSKEVLDSAFSIQWEEKLKHPKNILRGVARVLSIPEYILVRPKSGFGISSSRWALKGGAFDALVPLAARCFEDSVISNTRAVDVKSAMTFWNILNYSIWKRLCIDGEPLDALREELDRGIADGRLVETT